MGIGVVPVADSIATAGLECGVQVDINALHKMLSHVGKDATIKTATNTVGSSKEHGRIAPTVELQKLNRQPQ
jgi:hypothetical protein